MAYDIIVSYNVTIHCSMQYKGMKISQPTDDAIVKAVEGDLNFGLSEGLNCEEIGVELNTNRIDIQQTNIQRFS